VRRSPMVALTLAAGLLAPAALTSQTLPARPVPFEEPVRGGNWKDGELILGKTTLAGARRMLAPSAGPESTHRIPDERAWDIGGVTLRPRWEYDPGPEYFQLFFDDNERLIFALDRAPHRSVDRTEFLSHYPRALRAQQSGSFDQYQVDAQPCVTLTALVDRAKDQVTQFGYAWTCRTRPVTPAGDVPGSR
ncbi:MAG TPA: hypothetical protein VEI47_10015, partial [Gemmatimonadales bacterium]|nr:hypothetical protein [Gemmatimonadales bacterium]